MDEETVQKRFVQIFNHTPTQTRLASAILALLREKPELAVADGAVLFDWLSRALFPERAENVRAEMFFRQLGYYCLHGTPGEETLQAIHNYALRLFRDSEVA